MFGLMRVLAKPAFHTGGLNPYTRLLYTPMRLLGVHVEDYSPWRAIRNRYQICHIHWPEYYIVRRNPLKAILGSAGLLLLVFWCRTRGAKVVWTVHNLGSHDQTRPRAEKCFWNIFTRCLHAYIALTEGGCSAARERFPTLVTLPAFVIPHGHYRSAYSNGRGCGEARRHLGVPDSAKVILFFGTIAPYKNVPALVKALREDEDPDTILVIAGACVSNSEETKLRQESSYDSRIKLHIRFVPEEEVQWFFLASDLVVLPFSEILNSGSALLALSFDRPILVPAKGAMPELEFKVGRDWVQTYEGRLTGCHLKRALAWALNEERPKQVPLDDLDWGSLAAATLRAYESLLNGSHTALCTGF
jgi:beta-1,4-mannosyltransferase